MKLSNDIGIDIINTFIALTFYRTGLEPTIFGSRGWLETGYIKYNLLPNRRYALHNYVHYLCIILSK